MEMVVFVLRVLRVLREQRGVCVSASKLGLQSHHRAQHPAGVSSRCRRRHVGHVGHGNRMMALPALWWEFDWLGAGGVYMYMGFEAFEA